MTREPEEAGAENRSPADDVTLASDERAESDASSSATRPSIVAWGRASPSGCAAGPRRRRRFRTRARPPAPRTGSRSGRGRGGRARLARLRAPRDPRARPSVTRPNAREGADGFGDERGDESGRIGATSAGVEARSEPASRRVPRGIGSESRPRASGSSGLPPRRGARMAVGVLSTRRAPRRRRRRRARGGGERLPRRGGGAGSVSRRDHRRFGGADGGPEDPDQRTRGARAFSAGDGLRLPHAGDEPSADDPSGTRVVPADAPRGSAASPASEARRRSRRRTLRRRRWTRRRRLARRLWLPRTRPGGRARVSPAELERRLLSENSTSRRSVHEIARRARARGDGDGTAISPRSKPPGSSRPIAEAQTAARRESEDGGEGDGRTNDSNERREGGGRGGGREERRRAGPSFERPRGGEAKIREESLARVKRNRRTRSSRTSRAAPARGAPRPRRGRRARREARGRR